jgi:hypothetical protein
MIPMCCDITWVQLRALEGPSGRLDRVDEGLPGLAQLGIDAT